MIARPQYYKDSTTATYTGTCTSPTQTNYANERPIPPKQDKPKPSESSIGVAKCQKVRKSIDESRRSRLRGSQKSRPFVYAKQKQASHIRQARK